MTIGMVICASSMYWDFLPRHLESVRNLRRQPDQITLVTDSTEDVVGVTRVEMSLPWNLGEWYNAGIAATDTDWIVWSGVDDQYRPGALDAVDSCAADVCAFGLRYTTGMNWIPGATSSNRILQLESNLITCGSPFRRKLWEQIPFEPSLFPVDDWGFWVSCAHQGASFSTTNEINVDYTHGPNSLIPDLNISRERIRSWLETL